MKVKVFIVSEWEKLYCTNGESESPYCFKISIFILFQQWKWKSLLFQNEHIHIVPTVGMVMLVATEGEVRIMMLWRWWWDHDDAKVMMVMLWWLWWWWWWCHGDDDYGDDDGDDEGDDDDVQQQARGARRHSGEMETNNQSVPGSPLRCEHHLKILNSKTLLVVMMIVTGLVSTRLRGQ